MQSPGLKEVHVVSFLSLCDGISGFCVRLCLFRPVISLGGTAKEFFLYECADTKQILIGWILVFLPCHFRNSWHLSRVFQPLEYGSFTHNPLRAR